MKDIKDQETLEANKENHDFIQWRKRDLKRLSKTKSPILMLSQEASSSEHEELRQISVTSSGYKRPRPRQFNSDDEQ